MNIINSVDGATAWLKVGEYFLPNGRIMSN